MSFNNANFSKVLNIPGGAGGETNGLYASVTESDYFPPDESYFRENSPSIFDFASSVISNVGAIRRQYQQEQASASIRPQPTAAAEWAGLSLFEKVGFALAVFGVVYLFVKK